MEKITKDMKIGVAVAKNPAVAKVLFSYGLHCVGCAVASQETIEEGAKAHGLSEEQIGKMLEEINSKAEEGGEK